MEFKKMHNGFRIEYRFVENDRLQYAQTPILKSIEATEEKLTELEQRPEVEQIVLIECKYHESKQ